MTTINTLLQKKHRGEKVSVLAAYDATMARLIADAGIDVILVGDSLGMVIQGQASTLPVDMQAMTYHTQAVAQGVNSSDNQPLVIADMPFMSYYNVDVALQNAAKLMQAGANLVKLEGGKWLTNIVRELVQNGIPVCAHLGLTPQSVNTLGGYRVQGKTSEQQQQLIDDTHELDAAGASLIVYECIPSGLAEKATQSTTMLTIGIGAGAKTDGQVLVVHDMLGATQKTARFVKNFLADASTPSIQGAFEAYDREVKNGSFPGTEHQYD